jgi:hypothetical protein
MKYTEPADVEYPAHAPDGTPCDGYTTVTLGLSGVFEDAVRALLATEGVTTHLVTDVVLVTTAACWSGSSEFTISNTWTEVTLTVPGAGYERTWESVGAFLVAVAAANPEAGDREPAAMPHAESDRRAVAGWLEREADASSRHHVRAGIIRLLRDLARQLRASLPTDRDENGSTSTTVNASGSGLVPSLLLVAFVFCKVAGVTRIAEWSWWWVLSPLWIGVLVVLAVAMLAGLAIVGIRLGGRGARWRRRRAQARRAELAKRDHTDKAANVQVEASAYVRREPITRHLNAVERLAASAGITVRWQPEHLRWRVRDNTTRLYFDVTTADIDHSGLRGPDDEVLALIIVDRLAELRA